MRISKIEQILMMDVFNVSCGRLWSITNPVRVGYKSFTKSLQEMYFDVDNWLDGSDDFGDDRLSMLGLDVERINNESQYWNYNTRTNRR